MLENDLQPDTDNSNTDFAAEVLKDYKVCVMSREVSLLGRKEVLSGKAKFGITGDGKEVPQVALARAFKKGDFRSGYYRDQTIMFALGLCTVEEYFAQLYADPDNDPFSGGRQMNAHFATPLVDDNGEWTKHTDSYNISSDISPTAGQMARAVGLAQASGWYRKNKPQQDEGFSENGNEVCFVTIGDASTSEGVFWESLNAVGVLQIPMAISVWDDGYGISVPKKYQTTKGSISKLTDGFRYDAELKSGISVYRVYGWDYPSLCEAYEKGVEHIRQTHIPALFHIDELTQPQGHSTSGSHERYKGEERLQWEQQHDCIQVMRKWIIDSGLATDEQLSEMEETTIKDVRKAKAAAWKAYQTPVKQTINEATELLGKVQAAGIETEMIQSAIKEVKELYNPVMTEVVKIVRRSYYLLNAHKQKPEVADLSQWVDSFNAKAEKDYHKHLYSETSKSALKVGIEAAEYADDAETINGYQILNTCFDKALEKYDNLVAFGEDVGQIGDVNQGFAGLQEKHGQQRVSDTGIREWTIIGQAIGMAMRGIRPIAEIQYLDYLLYGISALSDDLATLRYRSNGQQKAPAIIRTRGHRLEGIWHTGSPISMILGALRGMYVLVPRNMTQAAGFYNTLLQSDDPALVIECLNGYRLKEKLPSNIGSFTVPLGVPEVVHSGEDVTLVTYGSCVRIAEEAAELLAKTGVSLEIVDVQTLIPFDLEHRILGSLRKTNRIVFLDEDVPGGATAYMMQKVMEEQGGYMFLDSAPRTITAAAHRGPYGSDGDYFSKPQAEDVFEQVYEMMREAEPDRFG